MASPISEPSAPPERISPRSKKLKQTPLPRASSGIPFTPPSVTLLAAMVCHIRRARQCVQDAITSYTGDNTAALFDEGLSKTVADMVLREILFATDLLRIAASRVPQEARAAAKSTARKAARIHEPLIDVLSGSCVPPAPLIVLITDLKAAASLALVTTSEFAFEDIPAETDSSSSGESGEAAVDDLGSTSSAVATSPGEPLATQPYPGPALPPSEDLLALDVFNAIDIGQPALVVQLLNQMAGREIPHPLKDGLTPIAYAVAMVQPEVVYALIQKGADFSSPGWFGRSALSLAAAPSRNPSPLDQGMLDYMLAHLERNSVNAAVVMDVIIQASTDHRQAAILSLCSFLRTPSHTWADVPVTTDHSGQAPRAPNNMVGAPAPPNRTPHPARDRAHGRSRRSKDIGRASVAFLRHKAAAFANAEGYVNTTHVASYLMNKGHLAVDAARAVEVVITMALTDVSRFQVSRGTLGLAVRAITGHTGGLHIRLAGVALPTQVAQDAPRDTTLVYQCSRDHAKAILAGGWSINRDTHEGLYFEFISPAFATRIRGDGVTLDWVCAARAGITFMGRGDDTFYTRGRDGGIPKQLANGWQDSGAVPSHQDHNPDARNVRQRLQ